MGCRQSRLEICPMARKGIGRSRGRGQSICRDSLTYYQTHHMQRVKLQTQITTSPIRLGFGFQHIFFITSGLLPRILSWSIYWLSIKIVLCRSAAVVKFNSFGLRPSYNLDGVQAASVQYCVAILSIKIMGRMLPGCPPSC